VNEIQRKAAAAGFLHALQQSPETFNTWLKSPKGDHEQMGSLIQKTLGLEQKPTKDDIAAMGQHVSGHLVDQAQKVQALHADVPRSVGNIIGTQQDS